MEKKVLENFGEAKERVEARKDEHLKQLQEGTEPGIDTKAIFS